MTRTHVGPWPLTGFALALTPMAVFVVSTVNPSGLAVASAMLFVVGVVSLCTDPAGSRAVAAAIVAGALGLALTRQRWRALACDPGRRPRSPRCRPNDHILTQPTPPRRLLRVQRPWLRCSWPSPRCGPDRRCRGSPETGRTARARRGEGGALRQDLRLPGGRCLRVVGLTDRRGGVSRGHAACRLRRTARAGQRPSAPACGDGVGRCRTTFVTPVAFRDGPLPLPSGPVSATGCGGLDAHRRCVGLLGRSPGWDLDRRRQAHARRMGRPSASSAASRILRRYAVGRERIVETSSRRRVAGPDTMPNFLGGRSYLVALPLPLSGSSCSSAEVDTSIDEFAAPDAEDGSR